MKKIMIALLAIAVLFGFAACDNSSNTPSGDDTATVDKDYAFVAASQAKTLLARINAQFSAKAIYENEKYETGYSYDAASNSISWTETTPAVANIPEQKMTITLSGIDATTDTDETANQKRILLTDYVYSFVGVPNAADGDFRTFEGTLKGSVMGTVLVTSSATSDTVTKVEVAATTDPSVTATLAFYPAVASDVDVTYLGSDVDSADFVTYINNGVTYKTSDTLTSEKAYSDYLKSENGKTVYNQFVEYLTVADTGLTDAVIQEYFGASASGSNTAVTSSVSIDGTDAYAEIKIAPTGTENFVIASKASSDRYVVPAGEEFTIRFDAAAGSQDLTKFVAATYTINGTVKVYKTGSTFTANDLKAEYDTLEFANVTGKLDTTTAANVTITRASKEATTLAAGAIPADFTFDVGAAPEITSGTITTTVKTIVGPATTAATAEKPATYAALGQIDIACPVVK